MLKDRPFAYLMEGRVFVPKVIKSKKLFMQPPAKENSFCFDFLVL